MVLKNSPSSYTRLLQNILKYSAVDDIVIYSETFEEHLVYLDLVLKSLIKANLKLKLAKCCFARKQIRFLGNILSADGWQPDPEKAPSHRKELKRWLGMVGFYQKLVPLFSRVAEPLTKLLYKKVDFAWTDACESSFQTLKNSLFTEPILGYPDFQKSHSESIRTVRCKAFQECSPRYTNMRGKKLNEFYGMQVGR